MYYYYYDDDDDDDDDYYYYYYYYYFYYYYYYYPARILISFVNNDMRYTNKTNNVFCQKYILQNHFIQSKKQKTQTKRELNMKVCCTVDNITW